jgi:hypothetical protein
VPHTENTSQAPGPAPRPGPAPGQRCAYTSAAWLGSWSANRGPIADRLFEIEFARAGVEAYVFTFG